MRWWRSAFGFRVRLAARLLEGLVSRTVRRRSLVVAVGMAVARRCWSLGCVTILWANVSRCFKTNSHDVTYVVARCRRRVVLRVSASRWWGTL
jgi:hypothetical protein